VTSNQSPENQSPENQSPENQSPENQSLVDRRSSLEDQSLVDGKTNDQRRFSAPVHRFTKSSFHGFYS